MANSFPLLARNGEETLRPDRFSRSVFSILLTTFVINILSLALPIITLQIYDRILPNPEGGTLPVLIIGVIVAIILECLLRLSRAYLIGRAGASYEHLMGCAAIKKVLGADISRIEKHGIGEHLHNMNSIGSMRDFYNGHSLTVLAELAFVPLFLGLIYYISGVLVLVPIAIVVVFTLVSMNLGKRLHDSLKAREKNDDRRFNFLIEALEGIHTIKAFALESFFQRRHEHLQEKSTQANYTVTQITSNTFNSGAIFSNLMVACVISAGAWFVLEGQLSSGGLIAILLLSGRMMQPIQKGLALWARYQDFKLARENVLEVFSMPQQKKVEISQDKEIQTEIVPYGSLEVSNLSFGYKNDETPILKDISFSLKKGETILLEGTHGAGKTTLLKCLCGIYTPQNGEVRIDEKPIGEFDQSELLKHIGYVRTAPLLFRGTIRDNLTCFGQIPEAQAREVASLIEIDKDVAKLPSGFDTFLFGDNTDSIPPGFKQRITIARELARKPRIILFDNADRVLDKDAYATTYSLLARLGGKVSMIVVSQDRNIQNLATRRYVLQDGLLMPKETGSKEDRVSLFRELRV